MEEYIVVEDGKDVLTILEVSGETEERLEENRKKVVHFMEEYIDYMVNTGQEPEVMDFLVNYLKGEYWQEVEFSTVRFSEVI